MYRDRLGYVAKEKAHLQNNKKQALLVTTKPNIIILTDVADSFIFAQ